MSEKLKILARHRSKIYFPAQPMPPAADTTDSKLKNFLRKFTMMTSAPRELWIVYGAYIMENLAYKVGAASVLTLWLSADLGFGDKSAGAMIAVWSAMLTLITVLVGSLVDALGDDVDGRTLDCAALRSFS